MYTKITPGYKLGDIKGVKETVDYLSKEDTISQKQVDQLSRDNSTDAMRCVEYLTKEDRLLGEKESFFSNDNWNVDPETVTAKLVTNVKGLKKSERYFYMVNIAPSAQELQWMRTQIEQYAKVNKIKCDQEKERLFRGALKTFSEKAMDSYAENFHRKGISSGKDLVWYGRVEQDRYWKHDDVKVLQNKEILKQIKKLERDGGDKEQINKFRGLLNKDGDRVIYSQMPKGGDNYHVHILVSRKDKEQKVSLSSDPKFQSSVNHKINGRECRAGFNKMEFAERLEKVFDETFAYSRPYEHTIECRQKLRELHKEKEALIARDGRVFTPNEMQAMRQVILPSLPEIEPAKSQNLTQDASLTQVEATQIPQPKQLPEIKPAKSQDLTQDASLTQVEATPTPQPKLSREIPSHWKEVKTLDTIMPNLDEHKWYQYQVNNLTREIALHNINNKVWEQQHPGLPLPFEKTVEGVNLSYEIKNQKIQGKDTSDLETQYKECRLKYNQDNGLDIAKHTQNQSKLAQGIKSGATSIASNLFSEIDLSQQIKIINFLHKTYKACKQYDKIRQVSSIMEKRAQVYNYNNTAQSLQKIAAISRQQTQAVTQRVMTSVGKNLIKGASGAVPLLGALVAAKEVAQSAAKSLEMER